MSRTRRLPMAVRLGAVLTIGGLLAGCGALVPSPHASGGAYQVPRETVAPSAGETGGGGGGGGGSGGGGVTGADPAPIDAGGDDGDHGNGGTVEGGQAPDGLDRAAWIGTWRGDIADSFGVSQVETVFQPNGSFSNQTSNPSAHYLLTIWGQWDVLVFSDGPILRFTVEGWEPR